MNIDLKGLNTSRRQSSELRMIRAMEQYGLDIFLLSPRPLCYHKAIFFVEAQMSISMKVLDHQTLLELNENSIQAGRSQNIQPGQIPSNPRGKYVVNFHLEHMWKGEKDVRLSVILRPGVLTAWLDVSLEEYASIPEVQMSEVEWEAAICVGMPPWTA